MSFDQNHEALLVQLKQLHQYSNDLNYTRNQDFVNTYNGVKQALRTMHFQQSKIEQAAKPQMSIEKAFITTPQTTTTTSQPTQSKLQKMYDAYNEIILSRPQGTAQTTFVGGNAGAVAELKKPVVLFQECINLVKGGVTAPRTISEKIKNTPLQVKLDAADISQFSRFAGFNNGIQTRPSFHLWNIHENEDKSRVKKDLDYGGKAFIGTEEGFGATEIQRIRALKRTIVEVSLAGLERAVYNCDDNGISHFLNILENIEYHEKDFPEEQKNYAHWLFGEYYNLHRAAWQQNTGWGLDDPHDQKYKSDFGRNGFKAAISGSGLSKEIQTEAIFNVCQQLKAAWKL
jgi:hypothetical protein